MRDLTENERSILSWLLRDPRTSDAHTLRAQIPHARVVDREPYLPSYLDLAVIDAPAAACEDGPLPGQAMVVSASGEPTGGLILWIDGGYVASVEHYWYSGDMPTEFPSVDLLRTFDDTREPDSAPSTDT